MNVYLGDVTPKKDDKEMTEEEFWAALKATTVGYNWGVAWEEFSKHWHIRSRNSKDFCPITAVAMFKLDTFYEACEWDDAISSTIGINLPHEFAHKIVDAADDNPQCDQKIRARMLEILGLTTQDKLNREEGPPEETKTSTPIFL